MIRQISILIILIFTSRAIICGQNSVEPSVVRPELSVEPNVISVGTISEKVNHQIIIPVLNQSRNTVTLSHSSFGDHFSISSPKLLESYEQGEIILTNRRRSAKHFNEDIYLHSNSGSTYFKVKGRYTSDNSLECYDFKQRQQKVKYSSKYITKPKQTAVLQLIDPSLRGTLFTSDPVSHPYAHFVFLIDASGSMGSEHKLSSIKEYLSDLLDQLRPTDYISVVRYSDESEIVVAQGRISQKEQIRASINGIRAGGFTNGQKGIETSVTFAYNHQINDRLSQIVLFSDGQFNTGGNWEEIEHYLEEASGEFPFKYSVVAIEEENEINHELEKIAKAGKGIFVLTPGGSLSDEQHNKQLLRQLSIHETYKKYDL